MIAMLDPSRRSLSFLALQSAKGGHPANQNRPGREQVGTTLKVLIVLWIAQSVIGEVAALNPNETARNQYLSPKYKKGELIDISFYTSEDPLPSNVAKTAEPFWSMKGVRLGDHPKTSQSLLYKPSKAVQNNGTLFIHVHVRKEAYSADPLHPDFQSSAFFTTHSVVKFAEKPGATEEGQNPEIISFVKPNLTVTFVDDFELRSVSERLHLVDRVAMEYYPVVFFNDAWILQDHLIPMTEDVTEVPMHITLGTMSEFEWFMSQHWVKAEASMDASTRASTDDIKKLFLDNGLTTLVLTLSCVCLSATFGVLKKIADIAFWRNKTNVAGLSVQSVPVGCILEVFSLVGWVSSYTSNVALPVTLASAFIGMLIELWKITKAMHVSIGYWPGGWPCIRFADKPGYSSTMTKQYDDEAMRYMRFVGIPLVVGSAAGVLTHAGLTSSLSFSVLSTLASSLSVFGRFLACPQLYINWKMRSAANLPWLPILFDYLSVMMKDMLSLVVREPFPIGPLSLMHHLIVLVFFYQLWAYRIRRNPANQLGSVTEQPPRGATGAGSISAQTEEPRGGENASASPVAQSSSGVLAEPPSRHGVSSPVLGSSSSFEDLGTETESLPSEGIKDNPAGPLAHESSPSQEVKKQL